MKSDPFLVCLAIISFVFFYSVVMAHFQPLEKDDDDDE